jgi:hypothetical protein
MRWPATGAHENPRGPRAEQPTGSFPGSNDSMKSQPNLVPTQHSALLRNYVHLC